MNRLTTGIRGNSLRSDYPLTVPEMMAVAPSIFATEPYRDRSDKYAFTSTADQLAILRGEGFEPFFVAQSKSRIADKRDHTKHMVRLRRAMQINAPEAEEVILVNDSAGMTSNICYYGLVRFACQNGLITGSLVNEVRIAHRGHAKDDVIEGVYSVLDSAGRVRESVDEMKAIQLTRDEQVAYAEAALGLRWEPGKAPIQAEQLIRPRRQEDTGRDLFTTFNVVQEALIRGGLPGRTSSNRRTKTRQVTGIDTNVKLNRAMWDLTEKMKELKGH